MRGNTITGASSSVECHALQNRQFLHPSLPLFRSLFLNPSSWSLSLTVTVTVFFWAEESRQFYLFSDPEFDRLFSNPQPQTVPCYEKSQVSVIRQLNSVSLGARFQEDSPWPHRPGEPGCQQCHSLCSSHHKAPCGAASLAYSRP